MRVEPLMELSEISDEEIVRLVCAGQREHFALLVERHQRSVYHIVLGILGNPADAEEVLQEGFLKALQHLSGFRGEAKFRTWLTRIAINEARMRIRKYRSKLHDSLDESFESESDLAPRELRDWRPNPEEIHSGAELKSLLERAIRALPTLYREVLILRDVEHLSSDEVAAALEISVPAAKTRLLRARLMLRDYLEPHFVKRWHHRIVERITPRRRRL